MSVYISNLPLYTGNTYNGYIIWNDSGETTTYKTLFQQQLVAGTGSGETYRTPTATASGGDSIAIGAGATHDTGTDGIAIGKNAFATSNRSTAIGGSSSSGGAGTALGWGCKANGLASVSLGYFNETPNQYALALGSSNSVYADFCTAIGGNNYMVGGTFNITFGWDIALSSGSYNTMLGGKTNTFTSTGSYNSIFNGSGNTLGGSYSGVSMFNCFGRTANNSNTTYVENLHTYRTPSTEVQPISSGTTFTCNLDNGAKSQFYITGTSTINITNVRDGASFMIKTQTDGNHTITWSATGYTFVFTGGLKDPGNNVTDIFVFEVFGSVIYGNRRHNYS
jgi:hypothetical protein